MTMGYTSMTKSTQNFPHKILCEVTVDSRCQPSCMLMPNELTDSVDDVVTRLQCCRPYTFCQRPRLLFATERDTTGGRGLCQWFGSALSRLLSMVHNEAHSSVVGEIVPQ